MKETFFKSSPGGRGHPDIHSNKCFIQLSSFPKWHIQIDKSKAKDRIVRKNCHMCPSRSEDNLPLGKTDKDSGREERAFVKKSLLFLWPVPSNIQRHCLKFHHEQNKKVARIFSGFMNNKVRLSLAPLEGRIISRAGRGR